MKVYSCGCSFMSLDPQYPNTHFTEIITNSLDGELMSLAKPGASNFYVGLQVEYAITQKPNLIIVLFSNYDRVEVLKPDSFYLPDRGIRNIYMNNVDTTSTTAFSNVITNYTERPASIGITRADALKSWFSEIYDFGLYYHRDWFLCQGILHRLQSSGIPFIFNAGGMTYHAADSTQAWIGFEPNMATLNPWSCTDFPTGTTSGVYHTSFADQQRIAQEWLTKITQL